MFPNSDCSAEELSNQIEVATKGHKRNLKDILKEISTHQIQTPILQAHYTAILECGARQTKRLKTLLDFYISMQSRMHLLFLVLDAELLHMRHVASNMKLVLDRLEAQRRGVNRRMRHLKSISEEESETNLLSQRIQVMLTGMYYTTRIY